MISFGALDEKPETIEKVAESVCTALRRHGVSVRWNGSIHKRIEIDPSPDG